MLLRICTGLAVLVAAGCAARPPRIAIGALDGRLEPFLAAHALAPGQALRADEVARTAGASYHLVQVRTAESPHRHAQHDLTVYVLRGAGTLVLDGNHVPLRAGDVVLVPRGASHWFANGGGEPALALVAFTPPLDAPDTVPTGVDSSPGGR
jgi:mannose-6-phosphate isomerase-like protein (cupin superfamily)